MVIHKPILTKEIYEHLPKNLSLYLDGTIGHWWHVDYILSKLENWKPDIFDRIKVIWIDRDSSMLEKAKQNISTKYITKIKFQNNSYTNSDKILAELWLKADFILLDIGVNMEHFKDAERWFSIKKNWILDMRFDLKQEFNSYKLIKTYSKEKLKEIFQKYWDIDEKNSYKIADEILRIRNKKDIETTFDLKEILANIGLNERKISVIFQTIRIEVNKELDELENFLWKMLKLLNKGWRCAIITFHSIEDRIVKNHFKQYEAGWKIKLINKKVIKPNYIEKQKNKASKSAKLRIIELL